MLLITKTGQKGFRLPCEAGAPPSTSPSVLIREPRGVAMTAVVLAAVTIVLGGLMTPLTLAARSPLAADMAQLFGYYSENTGLIGSSWWQAAVALSTVEAYAQATGDNSYDAAIASAFELHSGGDFENDSDDDTAWWALVWLQAYDITHVPAYLSMAETDADYIHEGWDRACGGGIWWQRNPGYYKNAISNELFLELTAWLHNTINGDVKYLTWAEAEWSWFSRSGMINGSDLVNDGVGGNCKNNGAPTWTYNQGVILAGLAQLYQATGNRSLLTTAEQIARAAIGQLTVGGVLTEPCAGSGCAARLDRDSQAFKGIFVQDLKVLAVTAGTSQFNAFFSKQARSIDTHDATESHDFGMSWSGPAADVSSATQASALAALVAALGLPGDRHTNSLEVRFTECLQIR
jgi:predicted alpha-1,6-mannanase (GH76 family)